MSEQNTIIKTENEITLVEQKESIKSNHNTSLIPTQHSTDTNTNTETDTSINTNNTDTAHQIAQNPKQSSSPNPIQTTKPNRSRTRTNSHSRSHSHSRSRSRSRSRNNGSPQTVVQSRAQQRAVDKQSDFDSLKVTQKTVTAHTQSNVTDIETAAKSVGLDYYTLKQIQMSDEKILKLIQEKQAPNNTAPIKPKNTTTAHVALPNQERSQRIHTMAETDKNIIGATELAGKNNDKIPLPNNAKEENAIFVGDLHHLVTRKDLLSVFGKIGKVIWIQLFDCHAQLNRPFNFAFVYYTNPSDANQCIQELNFTKFYGNPCRVMLKSKNQLEWTNSNLIVKNLPPNTNSQILFTLFEPYGTITSSKVKTTNTGRTLPYGYVQFDNYSSAKAAMTAAQNRQIRLGENMISAEWFRARDARPNKQIFIKNIPAEWDEKRIIEFVQNITKYNIASISTKSSPYGKWACVAFYEFTHAQMAIKKLNGLETGDFIHPKLTVTKFMNKAERDRQSIGHSQRDHRPFHGGYHRGNNTRSFRGGYHHNNSNNFNGFNNRNRRFNNGNSHQSRERVFGMYSLYVGNIPRAITESHLQQIFESFGKIRTCHILEKTIDFRYGFVNFAYAEDAARALVSMNGKTVGDKCLQVKPTQKDGGKCRQIEYFANVIQSNQTQFTHRSGNGSHSSHRSSNNYNRNNFGNGHMHSQQTHTHSSHSHSHNRGSQRRDGFDGERVNPATLAIDEAERILCSDQHIIVWKVQYGDEWHEYNTQLAALTEQLRIGSKTTITLSDSDYLLTKIDEKQALQQNLTTGTTRKVVRLFRSKR